MANKNLTELKPKLEETHNDPTTVASIATKIPAIPAIPAIPTDLTEDKEIKQTKPPEKLKIIEALNDYLALLVSPVTTTNFELTEEAKAKFANEGLVIGIGPDVNKGGTGAFTWNYTGTEHEIILGDRLVVRANQYMRITPKSGVYADKVIMMVHKLDLVLRHSRATPGEFDFTTSWTKDDTETVRNEIAATT